LFIGADAQTKRAVLAANNCERVYAYLQKLIEKLLQGEARSISWVEFS
jgi:hypothetical protein